MTGLVHTNIWTMVHSALDAAQGWKGFDAQHMANLQGTLLQAEGLADRIDPIAAQGILEVLDDPRAAQYFGPKKMQDGRLTALRSMLQPRAALASRASGPFRELESFTARAYPHRMDKPREIRERREEERIQRKRSSRTRGGLKRRGKGVSQLYVSGDMVRDLKVKAHAFGDAMQDVFDARFGGDVMLFAEATGLRYAECDAYLRGYLPPSFHDVVVLETKLRLDHGTLADAWLSDQMALLEARFPLPRHEDFEIDRRTYAPKREVARLVRLASLRRATTSEMTSVASDRGEYRFLRKAFNADLPVTAKPLKKLFDFIIGSGAVTESDILAAIGRHVNAAEKWEGRTVGSPFINPKDGAEFDHTYVDVYATDLLDRLPEEVHLSNAPLDSSSDEADLVWLVENISPDHQFEVAQDDDGANTALGSWATAATYWLGTDPLNRAVIPESFVSREPQHTMSVARSLSVSMRRVLATLTPREEKVLKMRCGIGKRDEHSLDETGKEFEVTSERIRQIEAKGLRKLRHPARSKRLRDFMPSGELVDNITQRHRQAVIEAKNSMWRLERTSHLDESRPFRLAMAKLEELSRSVGVHDDIVAISYHRDTVLRSLFDISVAPVNRTKVGNFRIDSTELWNLFNEILLITLGEEHMPPSSEDEDETTPEIDIERAGRAAEEFYNILRSARPHYKRDRWSWLVSFREVHTTAPLEATPSYWIDLAMALRTPVQPEHGALNKLQQLAKALHLDPAHEYASMLLVDALMQKARTDENFDLFDELARLFESDIPAGISQRIWLDTTTPLEQYGDLNLDQLVGVLHRDPNDQRASRLFVKALMRKARTNENFNLFDELAKYFGSIPKGIRRYIILTYSRRYHSGP